ncbi:hypothetical protein [Sagittula salina]|uniref:Flagellar protein FlgN n=1 Tax=Sagittula salina TaxID=2820268 RepID=A0A940MN66_9RHOB|nr:hypothetical protein [Sagittula salina]MBP0484586.1 hypothetical protein [Sagittula salina]
MTDVSPARAHQLIDRLARLLRDEIAAIGQGQLARVEELFPLKSELLGEIATALGQPEKIFLASEPGSEKLREKLDELRGLIRADLALLQRMTQATGDIAREIDRIRDRQSLRGLYGRDGSTANEAVTPSQRFDQSI